VEHRRGNAEKGRHGDVCGEARETIMRAESKGAQAQWRYRRRPREGGVLEAIQGAAMKVYETADGGGEIRDTLYRWAREEYGVQ
jgi:hypothetical protein